MYSSFQLSFKYLHYCFNASNGKGHGIHSPFVFDFITKVLNDKIHYPEYDAIEKLRNELLNDKTLLTIEDLGAGSSVDKTNLPAGQASQRTVASIAKNAMKSKKYGQLLFRIVKKYKPQNILELGTSLGITTSYLASATPEAKVFTMEGSKVIADKALNNFKLLNLLNIKLIKGNFNETLTTVVHDLLSVDFAFIDGNHRKEPTIQYFNSVISKINNFSIVVLDDIHWSREMEEVWDICKKNESVTLSIDLFFMGFLFFRKEMKEKQHFTIRF